MSFSLSFTLSEISFASSKYPEKLPSISVAGGLAPLRNKKWVVYAKPPFAGPEAVLAYLSRYTHRVAISNRRLISLDETGVTFRYKDYRRDGVDRQRTMTLSHRRVHPSLSPARSAERLSPHPALRPARQRRPQGQCRPRQGPARRPRAARDGGADAAAGSIATVSVLRRSHGRHRDHPRRPQPRAPPVSPASTGMMAS